MGSFLISDGPLNFQKKRSIESRIYVSISTVVVCRTYLLVRERNVMNDYTSFFPTPYCVLRNPCRLNSPLLFLLTCCTFGTANVKAGSTTAIAGKIHSFQKMYRVHPRILPLEITLAVSSHVSGLFSFHRVVPTIPVETKQPFSSTDIYKMCLKADGKLNTELIWSKAAELGIHQFIQVWDFLILFLLLSTSL